MKRATTPKKPATPKAATPKRRESSPSVKSKATPLAKPASSSKKKSSRSEKSRIDNDALEPYAVTTAGHIPADPDAYKPYQVDWWWKVVRQDYKFYALYILGFATFTWWSEPCPEGHMGHDGRVIGAYTRVVLTSLFGALAALTLFIDIFYGTPAEPGDRKWHLMGDGYSGHFAYLTINILTTWAVYWPYSALVEISWLYSDSVWVRKAVTATYAFAVFSSTLGTLLTLLFLHFNWYNESWRRETLDMYDARGNTMFRKKILFTHLNQLPVAFLDVIVLKQNHHILEWATPDLSVLLVICFIYSIVYITFTHFNYRTNGGRYPYTFMDELFKSWKSEIIFIVVLSMFCFAITAFYHFIAEEADYVEEFIIKKFPKMLKIKA